MQENFVIYGIEDFLIKVLNIEDISDFHKMCKKSISILQAQEKYVEANKIKLLALVLQMPEEDQQEHKKVFAVIRETGDIELVGLYEKLSIEEDDF